MGYHCRLLVVPMAAALMVSVLGSATDTSAMEVSFRAENMVTASDNINRAPKGQELEGYLLSMQGGLNFSGEVGSGTGDLYVGGGWETLDDGDVADSDVFRLNLNLEMPWSETGYVRANLNSSDATEEPDITDVDQARVRTRRTGKRLEAGKRGTATLAWRMALSNQTEKRFDRDLDENEMNIGWDFGVNPRKKLLVNLGFKEGTEEVDGESWDGSTAALDLRTQHNSITSSGYRINWEGQKIERGSGPDNQTDKVGLDFYYETVTPSRWSFSSRLGMEAVKPPSGDRRWEPRAELTLESRPERNFQMRTELSSLVAIQDPREEEVAWTRDTRLRLAGTWRVTRSYTVEPSVQLRQAELFGNNITDRTDETVILRIATRWVPARDWSIQLNAQNENKDSTQAAFDLKESRIELTFAGAFF